MFGLDSRTLFAEENNHFQVVLDGVSIHLTRPLPISSVCPNHFVLLFNNVASRFNPTRDSGQSDGIYRSVKMRKYSCGKMLLSQ